MLAQHLFQFGKKNIKNATYLNVGTLIMDDLMKLLPMEKLISWKCPIIMKMDIEGSEHWAFDGANEIFHQLHITHVVMEWLWYRRGKHKNYGKKIFAFFDKMGYDAYGMNGAKIPSLKDHLSYNEPDIMFVKKDL